MTWLRSLWARLDAKRALGLASEMAFWLFLSLLPLAAVAGLLAAKLAVGADTALILMESLPRATQTLISTELAHVAAWNGGKVGVGAGLTFVWLASSGVHSVFDGFEIESDAPPRPWWKKRLMAIGTCVMLSLGVGVLAMLSAGVGWLFDYTGSATLLHALMVESTALGKIVRIVLGAGVSLGLVSGLYFVGLPRSKRHLTPLLPGAATAIGLNVVVGLLYGLYIEKAGGDSGAYLAGLASIGVTLMGLWLFCLALLVGITVNQMLGERRRQRLVARRAANARAPAGRASLSPVAP